MGFHDPISLAVKKDAPSVGLEDSLRSAMGTLARAGVSALTVKSGDDLVGVVTEMDIINSVVRGDDLDTVKVSLFMTSCELITGKAASSPCVQLDESESVQNALAIMHESGFHHLLVSGADSKAIGLVAAGDLLKLALA